MRLVPIWDADSEGAIEYALFVRWPSSRTDSGRGGYCVRWVFWVFRDLTDWFWEAAVRGDHGRSGAAPAAVPVRAGDSAREAALGEATYDIPVSPYTGSIAAWLEARTPFSATDGAFCDALADAV